MLKKALIIAIAASSFALAGCDVDQTEEGELPEVDVDVEGGNLPEFDVEMADVDVGMEEKKVKLPDVDVDVSMRETGIKVPDVDVTMPDENANAAADGEWEEEDLDDDE